jgi:spore germination protein
MYIHVVESGETLKTIAQKYNVPEIRLSLENELPNPNNLVVGQTIIITTPEITYTVKEGDNLRDIAAQYGVTVKELLRNNPYLSDREHLFQGETLIIKYKKENNHNIKTNGYAYTFIAEDTLKKTLPFLTYLSIFNYTFTDTGELIDINDSWIIQKAKDYDVAPIMVISTYTLQGTSNNVNTHRVLTNQDSQRRLMDNILSMLRKKGYYGLNVSIDDILPIDQLLYFDFISRLTNLLASEGYEIFITITSKSNDEGKIINAKELDFALLLSEITNVSILLSYEWGFTDRPPAAITPFNIQKIYYDYVVTKISPEKVVIGLPIIGYDWQLPYSEGVTRANSLSSMSAVILASDTRNEIFYDFISQSPFFQYSIYVAGTNRHHLVWFRDARSVDAFIDLLPEYGFNGVGIWNIMSYFPQMWLVINSQYDIVTIEQS